MFRIQVDNLKFKLPNETDPLFVISHLVVNPGEKLAIIGPNGTGKTSFLKALISKTESSQIKIHGTIAYVAQSQGFTSESGGEKVKRELNEAFDQHPDILLLDEPTANLDQENQNWLINKITHSRASILVVSHDQFLLTNNFSKVIDFVQKKKSVEIFVGSYSEYEDFLETERNKQETRYKDYVQKKKQLETQVQKRLQQAYRLKKGNGKKLSLSDKKSLGRTDHGAMKKKEGQISKLTQKKNWPNAGPTKN